MAALQRKLVHKQFNSPIGLYSQDNIKDTLNRELKAFASEGIAIDNQISRPLNLANSEVLRAVEEEEQMKCGYKRVAWPPTSEERIVREFTPQPQTQYQPAPAYNQQYQPSAAATGSAVPPAQQQYRAPSYDNYQQQQYPPQPQYQAQPPPPATKSIYQQSPQAGSYHQLAAQQQVWTQQQPAQQQIQQQYPWVQQPQLPQQQHYPPQQQSQYQNPFNQYNQIPNHQQQQQYPLQQNQFAPQINQPQFNSYSQPQQQPHTVSHDQVDQQQQHQPQLSQNQRGASPGIITLRKEAPVTQKPAPIYNSQPAAISFRESSTDSLGGSNMRGDLKWPPPEYKEAAVKENEERRKLALGPVCRPRKVNRDYSPFFAKNALSHHYPSYKVPPGTQHMIN